MVSLLIVDDSPEFCSSSVALLTDEGFEVLACVATGSAVVEAVTRFHPDVVLLDIQLPDIDGFEVSRRLASLDFPPAVVLISSRHAASYGDAQLDAPVRGFIDKVALDGAAIAALV